MAEKDIVGIINGDGNPVITGTEDNAASSDYSASDQIGSMLNANPLFQLTTPADKLKISNIPADTNAELDLKADQSSLDATNAQVSQNTSAISSGLGTIIGAVNVGTGEGRVFKQVSAKNLEMKTLKAGAGIAISNDASEMVITATASGGSGEVNTASNIGTGEGLAAAKSGSNLPFKSLKVGAGLDISSDSDSVTLSAVGASDYEGVDIVLALGSDNMLTQIADSFDVNLHSEPEIKQLAMSSSYAGKIVPYSIGPKFLTSSVANPAGCIPALFCKGYLRSIRYQRRVVVVPVAVSGSSYTGGSWNESDPVYQAAVLAANTVIASDPNSKVVSILWHSGEEDAEAASTAAEYVNYVADMVSAIRLNMIDSDLMDATYRSQIPFIVGGMASSWYTQEARRLVLQSAIESIPTYLEYSAYVDADDLTSTTLEPKIFTVDASEMLGQRYFSAIETAKANDTVQPLPPTGVVAILGLSYLDWLTVSDQEYIDFKAYVDAEIAGANYYGYEDYHSVLMYYMTDDPQYINFAITGADAWVASEEARGASNIQPVFAGDGYLQAERFAWNVSFVYFYGYDLLTTTQRSRFESYLDQGVYNLWNRTDASWYGFEYPSGSEGWGTNDPGNNYFYHHINTTIAWAYGGNRTQWIDFLNTVKIPQLQAFNTSLPGGGNREGTGYGKTLRELWKFYIQYQANTGIDIAGQDAHCLDSLRFWLHSTVPTLDAIVPYGDLTTSYIGAYHAQNFQELSSLNQGTTEAKNAEWWLANAVHSPLKASDGELTTTLYERTDSPEVPTTLNHYSALNGILSSRSGWGATDTYCSSVAGIFDQSHQSQDQGSFNLYKNSWLAVGQNTYTRTRINQQTENFNVVRFRRQADGLQINSQFPHPAWAYLKCDAAPASGEVYTFEIISNLEPTPVTITYTSSGAETAQEVSDAISALIPPATSAVDVFPNYDNGYVFLKNGGGISNWTLTPTTSNLRLFQTVPQTRQASTVDPKPTSQHTVNLQLDGSFTSTMVMDQMYTQYYPTWGVQGWTRDLVFSETRLRITDDFSLASGTDGVFQINTRHEPVVTGTNTVTVGDMTITVYNPATPVFNIINWYDLDPYENPIQDTLGSPFTTWRLEIEGGTTGYDVFIQLPGDPALPSNTTPFISNGSTTVPVSSGINTINLGDYLAIQLPAVVDWSSAVIVSPPASGVFDTTELTVDGTVYYTPPTGVEDAFVFTWQVDNDLAETSNIGQFTTTTTNTNFPLVEVVNDAINADVAESVIVSQAILEYTSLNNSPSEIVYTVDTVSTYMLIKKSGGTIAASGTFTQEDINNNIITVEGAVLTGSYTIALTVRDTGTPQNSASVNITGEVTQPGVFWHDNFNAAGDNSTSGALVIDQSYTAAARWTQRRDISYLPTMTVSGGELISTPSGSQANYIACVNKFTSADYELDFELVTFNAAPSSAAFTIGTCSTDGHDASGWADPFGLTLSRTILIKPTDYGIVQIFDKPSNGNLLFTVRSAGDGAVSNGVTLGKTSSLWATPSTLQAALMSARIVMKKFSDRIEVWFENSGAGVSYQELFRITNNVAGGAEFTMAEHRPFALAAASSGNITVTDALMTTL